MNKVAQHSGWSKVVTNERIKNVAQTAGAVFPGTLLIAKGRPAVEFNDVDQFYKFAELIIKACADAADMAYEARCEYPGDYVAEQMGCGIEEGVATWRAK